MTITEIAEKLVVHGINNQSQDLYILPHEDQFAIFFRKGHNKKLFQTISSKEAEKLIAHFKFISGMDVGENRKVQVGSVSYSVNKMIQRLRLSTVGDFKQRESLVIRFLHHFGKSVERYYLPSQLQFIQKQVKRQGLYLFCGPVGSGKTTLMYKLAKESKDAQQVITVEDPVEIEETCFLQLQTNEKINITYDELIKLCLRHRPDILIIGEIRDEKTARAAIRASLTGHTVFATLHARSVASASKRLLELGIFQQELEECIRGIIYQRLLPCAVKNKKDQEALLLDFNFTKHDESYWMYFLRKVWAYGFIDDDTFKKEAE